MVGCSRPAVICDSDHIIAWEDGGHTCPANLQALCARHHHAKHDAGWRVTGTPETSTAEPSTAGPTDAARIDDADDTPPF